MSKEEAEPLNSGHIPQEVGSTKQVPNGRLSNGEHQVGAEYPSKITLTAGRVNQHSPTPNLAGKMAGSIFKARESNCVGLLVAIIYGTASTSMAFINKLLMTTYGFNYQFFLMFVQMLFTVVVLEMLRTSGRITLPRYTFTRGYSFLLPSIVYAVHSVLALHALSGMNIPMYGVVKRCGPMVTLILSTLILKKGKPTVHVVSSIALITTGCLIAGYGDLAFDVRAYTYGAISVFTQAFYLVILQKVSQGHLTALETLHLNSMNTVIPLFVCALALGEVSGSSGRFMKPTVGFLASFSLTITMGSVLNYLLFLCTTLNSALTTSVVGTLKSIVQTAIGMFTFGGVSINFFTTTGISMNLFGGVLYSYTKFHQVASAKKAEQQTMEKTRFSGDMTGVVVKS